MKRLTLLVTSFIATFFIVGAGSVAVLAYNPLGQACQTVPAGQQSATCNDAANQSGTDNPVIDTIAKAARVISLIIGFASVILIVVSGLNLVTSAGNPESVKSAKSRLVAAVIGLVVASLAWTIASFIIGQIL